MAQKYVKANIAAVQRLCVQRCLTQEALADKAEVHVRTINNLMAGKPVLLDTFGRVAKALDTPVELLMDGYKPPATQPCGLDQQGEPMAVLPSRPLRSNNPSITTDFKLTLSLSGQIADQAALARVVGLTQNFIASLSQIDVSIHSIATTIEAVESQSNDYLSKCGHAPDAMMRLEFHSFVTGDSKTIWMFHAVFLDKEAEFQKAIESDLMAFADPILGCMLAYGEGDVVDGGKIYEIWRSVGLTDEEFVEWLMPRFILE
jgi:transcriptional regulator with XRE-family HTH domain